MEPQIILFPDHVPETTIPSGVSFTIPCVTSDLSMPNIIAFSVTAITQNDSTIGTRIMIQEGSGGSFVFVVCGSRNVNFLVIDNGMFDLLLLFWGY